MNHDSKTICLFSGGPDSLLAMKLFEEEYGVRPSVLFVDYGQPAAVSEFGAVYKLVGRKSCIGPILSAEIHASTPEILAMERGDPKDPCVIPGRNALLVALAVLHGARRVVIGVNADDAKDYEDCRGEYLKSLGACLGVEILCPVIEMTKADIIQDLSERCPEELAKTSSCYAGKECGRCFSCSQRSAAEGRHPK